MSEPKLISPLLDNFLMGDPISDHHGIRCCPAMEKDSSRKYIVKIISLPSSENQLNALMLTGVLKDEEEAKKYFEDRAKELVKESEVLQQLARNEGFFAYDGYQIVPNEEGAGYDLYILSRYRRSLERQFLKKPVTHLEALNLGLDMCAALTACRRSGYLFTNLKPSNIYVTENGEYKISDFGFISLKSLKYATIPTQYIGSYTPPELTDAFSSMNETVDVYALGMILYRIYNGNVLPDPDLDVMPAPAYADSEISEIIMKACALNPEDRWENPAQMGQMIVNYMQKNGASNTPIIPPEEPEEPNIPEEQEEPAVAEVSEEAEIADISQEIPAETPVEELTDADLSQDIPEETITEVADIAEPEITEEPVDVAESTLEEQPAAEEVQMDPESDDEMDATEEIAYDELTDEVSQMLSQADELASMAVPEPVVAPEPIEVVLPVPEEEPDEVSEAEEADDETAEDMVDSVDEEESEEEFLETEEPAKRSHWLRNTLLILAGICILAGGFLFYKLYFLQTIDELQILGHKNTLTVSVTTETDESLLTISCTDMYGKTIIVPVVDGKAEFSGLTANAEYAISVDIKGFHALAGKTSAKHFTPTETNIVQYNVVTGTLPGTAILSFTVSGPDSENWTFKYGTSPQNMNTVSFTGHTVTISDLEENKVYTGILEPQTDLFIAQPPEITFTASQIIQATNLMITSCADGKLTAKWSVSDSAQVDGWNVRCYNGSDYDQTVQTTDTTVEFTGLDHTDSFTVEVSAIGQSFIQTATVGENSVTVENMVTDTSAAGQIALQWDASQIPEGGWIISYTMNGSDKVMSTTSTENRAVIKPAVPGTNYLLTVRAADASPTVCEPCAVATPEAEDFMVNYAGNVVTKDNLRFYLCKRTGTNWSHIDLSESDYTTTFRPGENAGYVVYLNRQYDISYETITVAFVFRDQNDQIVSISSIERAWTNMWYKNYCELNIPSLPDAPGTYTVSVYFNGQFAVKQALTIAEP